MENELTINYSNNLSENIYYSRFAFEKIVKEAFEEFFKNIENCDIKTNYRGYFFDAYSLSTNVDEELNNIFYVELKTNSLESDRNYILEPCYTLEMIRNEIFDILVNKSNKDTLLWKSKCAINISYFEQHLEEENDTTQTKGETKNEDKQDNKNTRNSSIITNFKIIIGESYKDNETKLCGIKYYAKTRRGGAIITYPNISLENFLYKNHLTQNNYQNYVNLIKNILNETKRNPITETFIIESMLYNLPLNLINNKPSVINLRNIINYIKNYPLQDYLTIDNSSKLFINENTNYNILHGKEVIRILENYYNKNFA